jgi:hypothetical protein
MLWFPASHEPTNGLGHRTHASLAVSTAAAGVLAFKIALDCRQCNKNDSINAITSFRPPPRLSVIISSASPIASCLRISRIYKARSCLWGVFGIDMPRQSLGTAVQGEHEWVISMCKKARWWHDVEFLYAERDSFWIQPRWKLQKKKKKKTGNKI